MKSGVSLRCARSILVHTSHYSRLENRLYRLPPKKAYVRSTRYPLPSEYGSFRPTALFSVACKPFWRAFRCPAQDRQCRHENSASETFFQKRAFGHNLRHALKPWAYLHIIISRCEDDVPSSMSNMACLHVTIGRCKHWVHSSMSNMDARYAVVV